jgi:hypothetical protein
MTDFIEIDQNRVQLYLKLLVFIDYTHLFFPDEALNS